MFRARLRKVGLKRALDASLYRGVASGAAAVVVVSEREADDVAAAGDPAPSASSYAETAFRTRTRSPPRRPTCARISGIPAGAPVILYVGRIAAGKGSSTCSRRRTELESAHVVLASAGDDRHGTMQMIRAAGAARDTRGRDPRACHPLRSRRSPLYPKADVLSSPSAGDSFGLVAAEAAAAGTPVIVSDRAGVAGFFADSEAIVVPDEREAVVEGDQPRARRPRRLRESWPKDGLGHGAALVLGMGGRCSRRRSTARPLPRARSSTNASTDGA